MQSERQEAPIQHSKGANPPAAAKAGTIGFRQALFLGISGILFALLLGESALRLVGFSYRLYPEKIEFGWPNPSVMASLYEPDNDLLWVPKEYQSKLAEYRNAPPQILFLGDSCTQFGNYDEFFLAHLKEQGKTVSVGKLGVGGWSSYQGLRQMQRDVLPLKPKVATIYYGWNDHWLGFGIEDRQIAKLRSPLFTLLEHSRLTQLVVKAAISRIDGPNVNPLRVSESDFRKNLWEMVETAKSAGIIPVLLTAPSSHRVGKEPAYLRQRHLKDLRQLVPLHQRYVEIVREVAKGQGVPLCDLAADFAALPESELVEKDFSKDGIHLTKGPGEGYDKLSQFLISCFAERGLLEKL